MFLFSHCNIIGPTTIITTHHILDLLRVFHHQDIFLTVACSNICVIIIGVAEEKLEKL